MAQSARKTSPSLQPYWKCLFGELFRQDPTHPFIKHTYLLIYVLIHLPVLFPETFGKWLFHFPDSYFTFDEAFLPVNTRFKLLKLLSMTTGLSYASIFICFTVTVAVFTALIWSDATTTPRPFPWPTSWETDNDSCYHDMFCEPSREGRLIRRPGNVLSNFLYMLLAFMILISTLSRGLLRITDDAPMIYGLVLSDFIFGVMLLILSVSSVIWHSCNAMWSHAVDLWSMEAVIIYLTIRIIALAIFASIAKMTEGPVIASFVSSSLCIAMFLLHIIDNGIRWHKKHTLRLWQHICPFAVRNRLPNSPYICVAHASSTTGQTTGIITLLEVYIFALLPVFSNILNWTLIKTTFHTVGSLLLVRLLNRSLVFGWTYRIFERWGLDGCWIVRQCESKIKKSKNEGSNTLELFWTASAALFSPTSVLHFWTGVTLIAAFCHSRSIEIFILSNLTI